VIDLIILILAHHQRSANFHPKLLFGELAKCLDLDQLHDRPAQVRVSGKQSAPGCRGCFQVAFGSTGKPSGDYRMLRQVSR